ncbi:MAG: tetratricopeptide repeat protein [Clostridia bacterium]|nr:tetratricopeptide repeat protein [Clostridia bacterium]
MIRIICAKCKNAYLQKDDVTLRCPSCDAVFPEAEENLLLGAQYYNEGEYEKCDDCLMKYIVKAGAEPTAIFYKALCDGFRYNEGTSSIDDVYEKLTQSLAELPEESFPFFLGLANDECARLEQLIADMHIRQFVGADAEAIKKLVSIIINLQNKAKDFRAKLTELAEDYNTRAANKISALFSKCFLVNPEIAAEVGSLKFDRIAESIASHTVFTGILSTDIKNLEIYYRCIVMFFERNRQKYDFLLASAEKFTELAQLLEDGKYSAIKGTTTIGDRLKGAAYDFFQESLKDHDEDEEITQTQSVVILESETVDISDLMEEEESEQVVQTIEDIEDDVEYEDLFSSSDAEPDKDESAEEAEADIIDITSDFVAVVADEAEEAPEAVEEAAPVEEIPEEIVEVAAEEIVEEPVEEAIEEVVEEATEEAADEEIIVEAVELEADEEPVEEAPSDDVLVYENPDDDYQKTEEIPIEEIVESTVVFDAVSEVDSATQELEDIIVDVNVDNDADQPAEVEDMGATIAIAPVTTEEAEEIPVEEVYEKPQTIKRKKSFGPFVAIFLIIVAIAGIVTLKVVPPKLKADKYYQASQHAKNKEFLEAAKLYEELADYEDSELNAKKCKYAQACVYESEKRFEEAKAIYLELGDYYNSRSKVVQCTYNGALADLDAGNFDKAIEAFNTILEYSDSAEQVKNCNYQKALSLMDAGDYKAAIAILEALGSYKSSAEKILEAKYNYVKSHMDVNDEATMLYIKELVDEKYLDSATLRRNLINPDNAVTTTEADSTEASTEATTAAPAAPQAQSGNVKAYINYSETDKKTAETKVDGTKKLYFHVEVNDPQYYGKEFKIYYKTSVGYESTAATFKVDANSQSHTFEYSSSFKDPYSIEFQLIDDNGKVIATQTVSVNS